MLDKTHNLEELIYFKNKTIEIKKIEDTAQIEKGRRSFWALTEENFLELINYTNEKIEITKN